MPEELANAYPRHNGEPRLIRSIVGFADLLGTKHNAAGDQAERTLVRLDQALRSARNRSAIDEMVDIFHTSWFSDNLCVAAPVPQPTTKTERGDEEFVLGFVLRTLIWLQFSLAIDGFFLRGGLTVGDQFADDEITFGPGLVRAASFDRHGAIPVIVIDQSLLHMVADHYRDYHPDPEYKF